MDNSNSQQIPQINIPPQPSVQPAIGESNKMIFWLIGGLVVILLTVGGIYWFLSQQQLTSQQQPAAQETTETPTDSIDNLDRELNSVDVQSADSELESIDEDLQNL